MEEIEGLKALCDNLNSRIEQVNKMQVITADILNNILAEQKLFKENLIKLSNADVGIVEQIQKSYSSLTGIIQALIEDYTVQIAAASNQPIADVEARILNKIGRSKHELFVVK